MKVKRTHHPTPEKRRRGHRIKAAVRGPVALERLKEAGPRLKVQTAAALLAQDFVEKRIEPALALKREPNAPERKHEREDHHGDVLKIYVH